MLDATVTCRSNVQSMRVCAWLLCSVCLLFIGTTSRADDDRLFVDEWQRNGLVSRQFVITGTEGRSNPLKRPLRQPLDDDEVFVRYRLRYDAHSLDLPTEDEGEFFVLWLDNVDGGDANTHSGGVPNLGIHVSGNDNRFMVRFSSGGERFADTLEGDREYLLVGRLWKSRSGANEPFDQWDLWVDPTADAEFSPDASAKSPKAISVIRWMGFSTGRKTEIDDRIVVSDITIAKTWQEILNLPATESSTPAHPEKIEPTVSFVSDVLPLLESRCFECHSGDQPESELRLDVLDEVINQTAPRNAHASRLFEVVHQGDMPPEGNPLTAEELSILQAWIDEGLDWDEQRLPTPIPQIDHWAFRPIERPVVPSVTNTDWVRTPVDAFIARQHEQRGIRPAPVASANTLARRLSLDLTGLPVSAFPSSMTVDDLLNHPAYGERWGRHWLDVARWAESNGHQHNRDRPHAWRYRDWVVAAFNEDVPYDQFVRQQLAGDELSISDDKAIIATGFLSAARYSGNELDKEIQRNDILVDIVNTSAKAFLGLTLECAQCHTHKFDPLSIRDYYRFQAFFTRGQPGNVVLSDEERAASLVEERWRIFNTVHDRLVTVKRKQGHPEPIYVIPKSVIGGMKPDERKRFDALEQQIAKFPQSWSFTSLATSGEPQLIAPHEMRWPLPHDLSTLAKRPTHLLIRGDVKSRGPEVQPGWPSVFGPTPENSDGSRTVLADWITNPQHPLTARVWVNRIWQWHFGIGLVETSGDFGTQGAPPSHPELLNYLASELIDNDWSTKHIHRLIVNSATYRQSSTFSEASAAIDPDNRLLWRWPTRRLEGEAVRDSVLAVSDRLDLSIGGPSVSTSSSRRSLYLKQKRDNLPYQHSLFDGASAVVSCSRRRVSTNALQPLWLLNSSFMQRAASSLAKRAETVDAAFEICLGRPPNESERASLTDLVDEFGLSSACLAMMNSSEFLYIP